MPAHPKGPARILTPRRWGALISTGLQLSSCAPGPEIAEKTGYWTEADEVCSPAGPPSRDCIDTLAFHLGIGASSISQAAADALVAGAFELWRVNAGGAPDCVGQVEVAEDWDPIPLYALCNHLEGFGDGRLAQRLYDRTAFGIREVRDGPYYAYVDGRMDVPQSVVSDRPEKVALTLLHEASHESAPVHVECWNGDIRCDSSWAGAYGIEAAAGALILRECEFSHPDSETDRQDCRRPYRAPTYSALRAVLVWSDNG